MKMLQNIGVAEDCFSALLQVPRVKLKERERE